MKTLKRLSSVLLAVFMVMAMAIPAFAQEVDANGDATDGPASIQVNNAAKGETYTVYKIFDATYNNTTNAIAYTYNGTLTENDYFTQDTTGAITATNAAKDTNGNLNEEAVEWVKNNLQGTAITSATSDGSALTFTGLEYGYYLVTSTLNSGSLVAVNSTAPNAVMNDKNTKNPRWDPDDPYGGKSIVTDTEAGTTANTVDANIGDTVTFKLAIKTQNYDEDNHKIVNYIIKDTLPEGLTFGEITSVTVNETPLANTVYTTGEAGKLLTVKWVDNDGNSLYATGAKLVVTYTATLNENAVIDGNGNVNTASFTYQYLDPDDSDDPDTPKGPDTDVDTDTATVYTYALAFKKVNESGTALSGATFKLPFKVSLVSSTTNTYVVDKNGSESVTTGDDGLIIVKGVKASEGAGYSITETAAPAGYNKLAGPFTVKAEKTGSSTTTTTITKYLDEDGNVTDTETTDKTVTYEAGNISVKELGVVVNKAGTTLPSTGGMGTTIFYVIGGILVIGAGVILVSKKRMGAVK